MFDLSHTKPLSSLVEWADNYNAGDVEGIARSIRRFGMNNALRVWGSSVVMAGNHTLKALKLIQQEGAKPELDVQFPPQNIVVGDDGEWHVPFIDVSHLDPLEAKAFAIADNETARHAVTNNELLTRYLHEINAADPAMRQATGVSDRQLSEMVSRYLKVAQPGEDKGAEPSRGEQLRDQWQTEPGQLWIIPSLTGAGEHRLLCGDSTSDADVERLMDGKRAVLFATDPPYLVDYTGTNHPHAWNKPDTNKDWSESYHDWDEADGEDADGLYDGFVRVAQKIAVVENAAWYCWHASRNQAMLENVWKQHGLFVHQQIVWVKDRPILTRSWYMWQHEPCLFGWVQGNKPPNVAHDFLPSVWSVPTTAPGATSDHPTAKPVELFRRPIEQHTVRGEICYEAFTGSGTQMVATEQLGRLCYGMEREPVYVAVILERLAQMGLKPRLEA